MSLNYQHPTLQIRQLAVRYRHKSVLHGIDLPALHAGELIALVGPNGAGKSTLMKALVGLVPASGQALFGEHDWLQCSAKARAREIGYMPQNLPSDSELSVLEATLAALQDNALVTRPSREIQALEALERLRIGELALTPLAHLSGGQRQLAALAQAVVRGSPVLMLDEPVSALDLAHQWQVMNTARQLANEGRIVLVVLHDLSMATRWADRVAVLHQGKLQAFGDPNTIITPPLLETVWGVTARLIYCDQGRVQVLVDGPAQSVQ